MKVKYCMRTNTVYYKKWYNRSKTYKRFVYICFQYNYILGFIFLGEMALIILIFVFYYVPESRDKLGIFPEKSLSEAIVKYGVEDDDDMVNLIDNIQKTVGLQVPERQLSNRQHQKRQVYESAIDISKNQYVHKS